VTGGKSGGARAEKAKRTRRRMVTAARDLFVQRGYAATTLQDVADRAGVAVQTIYFTFGNKRALLKEIADVTVAGDEEPVATMDRPWFRAALAVPTAQEQIRALASGARDILDRMAPIAPVLRSAAILDPDVADLWSQDPDPRYSVYRTAALAMVGKPGIRDDVTADTAADVLFAMLSPELYLLLVNDRGWPADHWEQWVGNALCAQLLVAARTIPDDPSAEGR
jgi:AcrR family transcriptional regulator